jgi:hypothetical protein
MIPRPMGRAGWWSGEGGQADGSGAPHVITTEGVMVEHHKLLPWIIVLWSVRIKVIVIQR